MYTTSLPSFLVFELDVNSLNSVWVLLVDKQNFRTKTSGFVKSWDCQTVGSCHNTNEHRNFVLAVCAGGSLDWVGLGRVHMLEVWAGQAT